MDRMDLAVRCADRMTRRNSANGWCAATRAALRTRRHSIVAL